MRGAATCQDAIAPVLEARLGDLSDVRSGFRIVWSAASLFRRMMDSPQTPMKDPHRAGIAADSTVRGTAIPIDSAPEPLRKRSCGTAWIPWVIAAALAIAVAGLGMKVRTLNHALRTQGSAVGRATEENVHSQRVLNLLRAPSAQHITLTKKPSGDPAGHAVYLADRGELIFQADHLKSLPEGKTYQLWLIPTDGRAPIPAGLFRPGKGGDASIVMPPLPVGVAAVAFGITIENAQGASTPTLPLVLSGNSGSEAE